MSVYNLSLVLIFWFFIITTILISSSPVTVYASGGSGHGSNLDWIPMRSGCRGTIAECFSDGEFELDSESNRRILASSRHISYEAMKKNSVPCSRRGASYYNCRPGAQANPYSRGCSKITRCRR